MNRVNRQKELDRILASLPEGGEAPTLFLHACCAPCSSYVLEYLSQYFAITLFYYNPNISPASEYAHRAEEARRLVREMTLSHPVVVEEGAYEPEKFLAASRGLEREPEGGARCFACYELRLRETARLAAARGFDWFCTTLSISPLKNAEKLNEIGERVAAEYGVRWLPSDFKKREGFKRSIVLSQKYHLYRQDYCGCVFSKAQRDAERRAAERAAE